MPELLLAIDGGGTKTQAAVCDRSGKVISVVQGPGCNPQDNHAWMDNLNGVIASVLAQTGKPDYSVIGMPGYDEVPEIDEKVQKFLLQSLGTNCMVINDVELAYHSTFPTGKGVLLLAGTGSMSMKIDQGEMTRVGGWGNLLGDEGSAYWVGQRVLQSLSRTIDGREPLDDFTANIAEHLGITMNAGSTELLEWLHALDHGRSGIAAITQQVDQLARAGDPRAIRTLKEAAAELAILVTTAHASNKEHLVWAHAGSMFKSNTVREETIKLLGCFPTPPAFDIMSGGLSHAATKAGLNPEAKFTQNLQTTIKDYL